MVVAHEDDVPMAVVNTDTSDNTSSLVGMSQGVGQFHLDTGAERIDPGAHDIASGQNDEVRPVVQSPLPVPTSSEVPVVGRPQRDRRPNVRYNTDEYDLSEVSATRKGLLLSGVYVKQGRPKDRGRC